MVYDPPEALSPYNIHLQVLVRPLYQLRELEYQKSPIKKRFIKAQPIIEEVFTILDSYNDFLLHRPLWEELHDRMVYYYQYLNQTNLSKKIPLFRTTLHNDAVAWWLDAAKKNKLKGPLLHFDTHDDMQIPGQIEKLITKQGNLSTKAVKEGLCSKINYPVTCILLSKKIDEVFWLMPAWVYDNNLSLDQHISICKKKIKGVKCDKNQLTYLRSSKAPKDKYLLDDDVKIVNPKIIADSSKFLLLHKFKFHRLHTEKLNSWKKLAKMIKPNKHFVLDIDLDYFVTNGDKITKEEYKKYFNDLESFNRVHDYPGIRTPQDLYDDPKAVKIKKRLDKEIKEICKRIDVFLNGLKHLKNEGLTPSVINFSDSTPALLSGDFDNAVLSNHYAPKYFVPYLHAKLISGLHKLYPNTFL